MKHSAWFRMAFLLLAAASALVSPIAEATTIHVTSTDDVLDPNDGLCTLREAVRLPYLANPSAVPGECASPGDNSAPYEIILPVGTFDLSIPGQLEDEALTGDLDIKSLAHTTIRGAGPELTTIDGNHIDRVLDIPSDTDVEISDLTVRRGRDIVTDPGAGIFR